MTLPVQRDARGRILPGYSGNPGGRTSALAEVRALLTPHVNLYVERLNELVRHPDPAVALPALREALDRLLGKPVASIEQDVRTLDMGQLYLAAVQMANRPPADNAVDVTPIHQTTTTTPTATTLPPHNGSDGHHEW
jgi:hypothetical protein